MLEVNELKKLAVGLVLILGMPAVANAVGTMFVTGDQVGVGTDAPADKLHVKDGNFRVQRTATDSAKLVFETANFTWEITQNANTGRLVFDATTGGAAGAPFKFAPAAVDNLFRVGVLGASIVDINGTLKINNVTMNVPDYVFEADYPLPTIEEQAKTMFENRHLPSLPPAGDTEENGVDVVRMQFGVLEELEKAHIYISQLNDAVKQLKAEIAELKK